MDNIDQESSVLVLLVDRISFCLRVVVSAVGVIAVDFIQFFCIVVMWVVDGT